MTPLVPQRCTLTTAVAGAEAEVLVSLLDDHVVVDTSQPGGRVERTNQPLARSTQVDGAGDHVQMLFVGTDGVFDLIWLQYATFDEAMNLAGAMTAQQAGCDVAGRLACAVTIETHTPGFVTR